MGGGGKEQNLTLRSTDMSKCHAMCVCGEGDTKTRFLRYVILRCPKLLFGFTCTPKKRVKAIEERGLFLCVLQRKRSE